MYSKSWLVAIIAGLSSSIALADMTVSNNTEQYATGSFPTSPCSSILDRGVLNPHQTVNIPQSGLDMFCSNSCEVQVYISKNCSGKKIATLIVNSKTGVVKVDNYNKEHYLVTGSGMHVDINQHKNGSTWWKNFWS